MFGLPRREKLGVLQAVAVSSADDTDVSRSESQSSAVGVYIQSGYPPVVRQRCVATRDRLEVLSGLTGHINHVGGGCAQLKSPAFWSMYVSRYIRAGAQATPIAKQLRIGVQLRKPRHGRFPRKS
jgi:hypothetical protein